jgi:hypothetical protein
MGDDGAGAAHREPSSAGFMYKRRRLPSVSQQSSSCITPPDGCQSSSLTCSSSPRSSNIRATSSGSTCPWSSAGRLSRSSVRRAVTFASGPHGLTWAGSALPARALGGFGLYFILHGTLLGGRGLWGCFPLGSEPSAVFRAEGLDGLRDRASAVATLPFVAGTCAGDVAGERRGRLRHAPSHLRPTPRAVPVSGTSSAWPPGAGRYPAVTSR